ncbi:protein SEH1 [Sesamum angolense]|uniref:Protein SEH1 n=1 Tax=Sesamum angolense TaxID=2727404 RepID=A0AAE2BKX9_9LAMI|nr:protein SEH1 [Sesamum angolense]
MDKSVLTLDKGTRCTAWNYSGQRLAAGLVDGSLLIYDSTDPASSTFISTSRFKVQESSILKVVWVPPEYGDAVACIGADGTLSLWEEVTEDTEGHHWKLCKCFDRNTSQVLDIRFGDAQTCLKLVSFADTCLELCFDGNTCQVPDIQFGDAQTCPKLCLSKLCKSMMSSLILWCLLDLLIVYFSPAAPWLKLKSFCGCCVLRWTNKIYELLDTLELEKWQLQAEFQNVIDLVSNFGNASCVSASISWNPQRSEVQQSSFVLGFSSNVPALNSPKVWEFDLDHQRWLPVAELSLPEDKTDRVSAVAWAPNIGRPYELIAVATQKGISIWHLGSNPDADGRLSAQKLATLSGHDSEVWEMEWDMSGTTLATTGSDGVVRLWQSNLNGVWHEQAVLTPAR